MPKQFKLKQFRNQLQRWLNRGLPHTWYHDLVHRIFLWYWQRMILRLQQCSHRLHAIIYIGSMADVEFMCWWWKDHTNPNVRVLDNHILWARDVNTICIRACFRGCYPKVRYKGIIAVCYIIWTRGLFLCVKPLSRRPLQLWNTSACPCIISLSRYAFFPSNCSDFVTSMLLEH